MMKRKLGAGGPQVSAIGLGCMSFGGMFGPTDTAESLRCLDAARDAGIDFFDTANIYGNGVSETVLGGWLASRKPAVTLATKAGIVNGPTRRFDNSAAHLQAELDASLRRLGVERVDLFYIHRRDPAMPIEDVVGSLSRLIEAGKIGGYGLSEIAPGTLRRAHAVHPCTAVQNEYSLWTRLPDLGLIQTCAELGVAFVAFSPLARGAFGDLALDPATLPPDDFRRSIPRFQGTDWQFNAPRLAALRRLAADMGRSTAALALAWVLDRAPHIIPIPGTRTAAHLAEWLGATTPLTAAEGLALATLLPAGWAHGDRYGQDQAATVERYC